jgi:hypothetical protein
MPNLSISKSASEKILRETDARSQFLGRPVIPRLSYYHRSYSRLDDGTTIEYGSGLTLSFAECEQAGDDRYLAIDVGSGCTLLVGPSALFETGLHSIDWGDRKFKLNSLPAEPLRSD